MTVSFPNAQFYRLFIDDNKLPKACRDHLTADGVNVTFLPYGDIQFQLSQLAEKLESGKKVWVQFFFTLLFTSKFLLVVDDYNF